MKESSVSQSIDPRVGIGHVGHIGLARLAQQARRRRREMEYVQCVVRQAGIQSFGNAGYPGGRQAGADLVRFQAGIAGHVGVARWKS